MKILGYVLWRNLEVHLFLKQAGLTLKINVSCRLYLFEKNAFDSDLKIFFSLKL